MNTIKRRACRIACVVAYAMSVVLAADVTADVPDGGYQFFTNLFSVTHDVVMLDEDSNASWSQESHDMAEIQALIDEQGWTTGQVVEALSYIVTNGVPSGTRRWPGSSLVFGKSLSKLAVFGGTNAIPAIEYVIDRQNPLVSGRAFGEYATILGFGQDAFSRYEATVLKPSSTNQHVMGRAYCEICNAFDKTPRMNAETNRLVGLLINASARYCGWMTAWELDERKCAYWSGYAASSNRLEHVNFALANEMPPHASNYFNNARSELLALPPGTMQVLPTNQFYNVED